MAITQTLTTGIMISPVSGQDTEGGVTPGRSLLLLETGTTDALLLETGDYLLLNN